MNLLVKKYAELIGLDPTLYGAHSLRHGFATYAALHGIEERLIMKQTRHKSVEWCAAISMKRMSLRITRFQRCSGSE